MSSESFFNNKFTISNSLLLSDNLTITFSKFNFSPYPLIFNKLGISSELGGIRIKNLSINSLNNETNLFFKIIFVI